MSPWLYRYIFFFFTLPIHCKWTEREFMSPWLYSVKSGRHEFSQFNYGQNKEKLSDAKLISDNFYVSVPDWFLFLYFKYWYFRSLKRFWDCDLILSMSLNFIKAWRNDKWYNKRVLIWRFTLVLIKINYGQIGDQEKNQRFPNVPVRRTNLFPVVLNTGFVVLKSPIWSPICP
jgi:hypothetical protein